MAILPNICGYIAIGYIAMYIWLYIPGYIAEKLNANANAHKIKFEFQNKSHSLCLMLALLSESRSPAAAERDIQGGFNLVLSGGWRGVLQGGALEEGGRGVG